MKKQSEVFQLQEISYGKVRIQDKILNNAYELEVTYLDQLDSDRLLAGFLETAGLQAVAKRYPGWEGTEIQGHTLGHYLTALCQRYGQTGDKEVKDRILYILEQLQKSQGEDGYLFASPVEIFDRVEQKKPAWVPWYTMHKLMEGLVAACEHTNHPVAYQVAEKLGDWIYRRTRSWSPQVRKTVLSVEYGGMNDCMYDLYLLTGNENYGEAAHVFDEESLLEAMYHRQDVLNGLHANTTIPKIIGMVKRYIALGQGEEIYLYAAANFWDMVVKHHTYVTGGNSEWEHFGEADILDGERTACNCETCNSYNMLKLTKYLFLITKESKYREFYERTFLNSILSSQNPKTGMTTYFQPMATGFFKVYGTPFDRFWCCTGTGMENFTKLTEGIYYKDDSRLYISRFVSSMVQWEEKDRSIQVTANLLEEGPVTICVKKAEGGADRKSDKLELALPIPTWLETVPRVKTENKDITCREENGFLILAGEFRQEETIELSFSMKLRVHTLPDNDHVVAFTYGPYVLSAGLGREKMDLTTTGVDVLVPKKELDIQDYLVLEKISIQELQKHIETYLIRQQGKMEFRLEGVEKERTLLFTPHFTKYDERYGIYWRLYQEGCKELENYRREQERKEVLKLAQIDTIPVGNDQYELAHGIRGEKTDTERVQGIRCRYAREEGWFSYVLEGDNQESILCVTYCAQDNGSSFDIYVNDQLFKQEVLDHREGGTFYEKEYSLPEAAWKQDKKIKVTFQNKSKDKKCRIFQELYIKKN